MGPRDDVIVTCDVILMMSTFLVVTALVKLLVKVMSLKIRLNNLIEKGGKRLRNTSFRIRIWTGLELEL